MAEAILEQPGSKLMQRKATLKRNANGQPARGNGGGIGMQGANLPRPNSMMNQQPQIDVKHVQ